MSVIRWGMIGCGAVAEVKSGPGFYKSKDSALLGVTSADAAMTKSFAERHGVPNAYASTEQLLANPEIDAVYVATPPSSHKPLALQAARAGKHVYVEKPMAMRFEECREIVDVCAQQGVRLYVAFYRRAMPRFLKIKEWIDGGAIGQVLCVRAVQHQKPAPEDLSRDTLPWRLKPEVARYQNNLGASIAAQGRLEEAVRCFQAALRIDPQYATAAKNLELAERNRQAAKPNR